MSFNSVYDHIHGLSFFHQPKVLRGIFSIVLVSLLMTLFETVFYKIVVEPQTKRAAQYILYLVEQQTYYTTKNQVNGASWFSPNTHTPMDSYLKTTMIREEDMIDRINMYAYITASFMILFLIFVLVFIHNKLSYIEGTSGIPSLHVFDANYKSAVITAIITVVFLASFQVIFYFFGMEFLMVGRNGKEELIFLFNNALRKNLGMNQLELSR